MVTTAHQNASGMDLKKEFSEPASAKYTALENSTTPEIHSVRDLLWTKTKRERRKKQTKTAERKQ